MQTPFEVATKNGLKGVTPDMLIPQNPRNRVH